MSALKVIVVTKTSTFQRTDMGRLAQTSRATSKAGYEGSSYLEEVTSSHDAHYTAIDSVMALLDKMGWTAEMVSRESYEDCSGYDLVLSIGGDGTVLHASHHTFGVPLLGLNSDPTHSHGYFCATDVNGAERVLRDFEEGTLDRFVLHRLRVELDGVTVGPPALNDILIANENPAAASVYVLIAGARSERQKSSGIWISTPAGSTAGIRSAGGVVLPLEVGQMQYLVREPMFSMHSYYELQRGVRAHDEGITVVSNMNDGYAYIDGPYEKVPLPMGTVLRVSAHEPVTIVGLEPARRER